MLGGIDIEYAAVVVDLDGTLLDSRKNVSKRNLDAVLRCAARGMKVIVATARPPRSVRMLLPGPMLEISSFVYYNGALVVDPRTGFEEHLSIERPTSADILDYCAAFLPGCGISVEAKDRWYAIAGPIDEEIFQTRFHQPHILDREQLKSVDATKLLITYFDSPEGLRSGFRDRVHLVVTDQGTLIQIMNRNVSKASGVTTLLRRYGIPAAEAIAFGDDHNDLELFALPLRKVAMRNAVDRLKELADQLTDTNDNDGVAQVLERIS